MLHLRFADSEVIIMVISIHVMPRQVTILFLQMLEAVQKRENYEENVWEYMETTVRDAALKYQTQPTESSNNPVSTFSAGDLEALILKATQKRESKEVHTCRYYSHIYTRTQEATTTIAPSPYAS